VIGVHEEIAARWVFTPTVASLLRSTPFASDLIRIYIVHNTITTRTISALSCRLQRTFFAERPAFVAIEGNTFLSIQAVLTPPFLALLTPAVLNTRVATDDIGLAACVVVTGGV